LVRYLSILKSRAEYSRSFPVGAGINGSSIEY
jgi:hypothetical protein